MTRPTLPCPSRSIFSIADAGENVTAHRAMRMKARIMGRLYDPPWEGQVFLLCWAQYVIYATATATAYSGGNSIVVKNFFDPSYDLFTGIILKHIKLLI